MSQAPSNAPGIRGATVTTEDGGRLNAFATEPRMEVVDTESGWGFHERAEMLHGHPSIQTLGVSVEPIPRQTTNGNRGGFKHGQSRLQRTV